VFGVDLVPRFCNERIVGVRLGLPEGVIWGLPPAMPRGKAEPERGEDERGIGIARGRSKSAIVAEIFKEFAATLVADFRLFGERAHDDVAETLMNGRIQRARWNGFFVDDFVDDGGDALAGEGFFRR